MPLRATAISANTVRLDYAVTLDGLLLEPIAPIYELRRRSDGSLAVTGDMDPDASPSLFSAEALVADPPTTLRAVSRFSYLGLVVEEEAAILDVAAAVVEVTMLPDTVDVAVESLAPGVELVDGAVEASILDEILAVSVTDPVYEVLYE